MWEIAVWRCEWQRGCMEDNSSTWRWSQPLPAEPSRWLLSSVMFMCSMQMSPVYACALAYVHVTRGRCHQLLPYFFRQVLSLNLESAFWDLILSLPQHWRKRSTLPSQAFARGLGSKLRSKHLASKHFALSRLCMPRYAFFLSLIPNIATLQAWSWGI